MRALTLLLLALLATAPCRAQSETVVPRKVIGLYDSRAEFTVRRSRIHRLVEMPLNHLGLVLESHDIRRELPSDEAMRDVRGIVTWFTDAAAPDGEAYIAWLERQARAGKRIVIIGHPGADPSQLDPPERRAFEAILARLGLRWEPEWVQFTYSSQIDRKERGMVEFERALPKVLPAYQRVSIVRRESRVYLSVRRLSDGAESALVATGKGGGYIAGGYAADEIPGSEGAWAWFIDPFRFFAEAFATDDVPKLDTTTLSGRRLYYSQIDGDGWHNESSVPSPGNATPEAAEIFYEKILLAYRDLPITVAPITGDLDPQWYGDESARDLARRMFLLPQVEAGSHTHSHPFAWAFFRNPDPRKEIKYLPLYPQRPGHSMEDSVWDPKRLFGDGMPETPVPENALPPGYDRPRSYAVKPFDLELEVEGSIERIQELLPPGKRVELLQWSGDTAPFEAAVARVRALGLRNINGGDGRMDGLHKSYAQLAPLGLRVGATLQVYSSTSNENLYTDNWRRNFFAFRGLIETLEATERPLRVKPINVYYHFYSAERQDSLNALRAILDYARRQELAPIAASRFAAMVDGFMSARIVALGERRWRIEERDALETVRFDQAIGLAVDFERSEGVVGQRHAQGSLYVALDRAAAAPIVALKAHDAAAGEGTAPRAYLISARWRIERLEWEEKGWRFHAQGFGAGEFAWKPPEAGRYTVIAKNAAGEAQRLEARTDADGLLTFTLPLRGETGADVVIERAAEH